MSTSEVEVATVPRVPSSLPLVGRDDLVASLHRLINAAAAGTGDVLVIVGEPGAGKSRLVQSASAMATRLGLQVRIGQGRDQAIERTLGVALDAFGMRLDQLVEPTVASRILLAVDEAAAAEFILVDRLLDVLERQFATEPVLVVIEDLHWSDGATLAWLRAVADRAAAMPLALLVTTRPLMPGARGRRTLDALAAPKVLLPPLTEDNLKTLAIAVLGHPPDAEMTAALRMTRGNALLALAVLGAGPATSNPLESRLAEVDAPTLRLLQSAAVLGMSVDPTQVAAVLDIRTPAFLNRLDAAVQSGVVVADHDRVRFRHDMYRTAVLATLSRPAQSMLHLHTARVLAAMGASVLDIAEHYVQGARPGDSEAVEWMRRAALAVVPTAPAAALRLIDGALTLVGPDPSEDLLLVRVRALAGLGRTKDAAQLGSALLHHRMDNAAESSLRRELAFAAAIDGRMGACVAEMQRCAELTDSPAGRARAVGELAYARFLAGDNAGARTGGERAVLQGHRYGDVPAVIAGDCVLCMLDLLSNRVSDAVVRAHALVERASLPSAANAHAFQPWFVAGLVWLETDDFDRLNATARRGREVAVQRGAGWAVPGYDAICAFGALRSGAFDDAAAAATATIGYLDSVDGLGVAVWCHSFLAQVMLHHGDIEGAETQIAAADGWLTRERQRERTKFGFEQLQLARSRMHERRGEKQLAYGALRHAWEVFRSAGLVSPLPSVGPALSRYAHFAGDHGLLTEICRSLDEAAAGNGTLAVRAISQLSAAWRDADPELALTAAAVAERTPRRSLTATALADAATLLRQRGRMVEAERISESARERWSALGAFADADACAASSRTARRAERKPRFGVGSLTATESRITAMVADGLSNPAIATALGISRRTVESHMASIYRKLEVPSRVAVARVALAHGISHRETTA